MPEPDSHPVSRAEAELRPGALLLRSAGGRLLLAAALSAALLLLWRWALQGGAA